MTIDKKLLEIPKGGRPKKTFTEEEYLLMLQQRQTLSTRDMAAVYGISYQTMAKRLRQAREYFITNGQKE